jgi:hypothetical protein
MFRVPRISTYVWLKVDIWFKQNSLSSGLPGAHLGIPVDNLSSAYNLLSNGAKGMTLYAQESLRLVRSLAREVLNRRHLLNTDSSSWP